MRKVILLVALLIVVTGCARSDWIDRTLVTVDVTGTWEGWSSKNSAYRISAEQEGTRVKGFLQNTARACANVEQAGPIEGSVAGDVFTFRQTSGLVSGQMTVSGDEMSGGGSGGCGQFHLTLRRVNAASGATSPKQ